MGRFRSAGRVPIFPHRQSRRAQRCLCCRRSQKKTERDGSGGVRRLALDAPPAPKALIHGEPECCCQFAEFLPFARRRRCRTGAQDSATQICEAWRRNEGRLRLRQARYTWVRFVEIQSVREVLHVIARVAWSQGRKVPAPLNQFQDGSMIEHQGADSRISRIPPAEG